MKWTWDDDDSLWGLYRRRVGLLVQALVLGREELDVAHRTTELGLKELAKRIRAQRGRRK